MQFVTPLFLLFTLAAAIPLVLHLISNVRAEEAQFPTLRFLKMSMEKTARRRKVQNLLLLLLRMAVLALLAIALSEPLSKAIGGWASGRRYASVLVLDNSMSMAARTHRGTTRFAEAKAHAQALLSGKSRPTATTVLPTNGPAVSQELLTSLDSLRKGIDRTGIAAARAPLANKVAKALEMLAEQSLPQKAIYIFSDLQKITFDELIDLRELSACEDVHMLVVNSAPAEVSNVAVTNLEITGLQIVDSRMEFTATVINSGRTKRVVNVGLRVEADQGTWSSPPRQVNLRPAGTEGSSTKVRFYRRFSKPGMVLGQVALDIPAGSAGAGGGTLAQGDDLPLDNVRRFCLIISDRVKALIAPGPADKGQVMGAATMLGIAIDPYAGGSRPWSIISKTVPATQVTEADLQKVHAVFFCNVPTFTATQARAIEKFARSGGTVVFFLGPDVDIDNYNQHFLQEVKAEGGLLPAKLQPAVGDVGPQARALRADFMDVEHRYLSGLFENRQDYLTVIVQRYFRLKRLPRPGATLIRLENGDPLLMTKMFGKGRVVLCATTASPRWSNLPITGLFLPLVVRIALLAPPTMGRSQTYLAGSPVMIRPAPAPGTKLPPGAVVKVTLPQDQADPMPQTIPIPIEETDEGYLARFSDTNRLGVYRWQVAAPGIGDPPRGAFVVNPQGAESNLAAMSAEQFKGAMAKRGLKRVYVAGSLDEVNTAAAADTKGRNWWDLILAFVIFVLVVEAVVANRRRVQQPPAALAPSASG